MIFVIGLEVAEALKGAEDFVADLGLNADEIEGGYVDGATGLDALARDVEELPVEVETFFGAEKVAREDEVNQELFTDAERIELRGGDGHQGRRWADYEGGHASESRCDCVGESVAVERGDVGSAEVHEGEDDDAVLIGGGSGGGLAESLGEHGQDAGGAFFFFRGVEGEAVLCGAEGDVVGGKED